VLFEGDENFEDSIEHVKASLLIHAIKQSPGGYKLSFELILWLAANFEDAYLPGNAQAMGELIHDVTLNYERHKEDLWYLREQEYQPVVRKPTRWQRIKDFLWR
jgi:hypothetical protein